jgi:hypothetical protein
MLVKEAKVTVNRFFPRLTAFLGFNPTAVTGKVDEILIEGRQSLHVFTPWLLGRVCRVHHNKKRGFRPSKVIG